MHWQEEKQYCKGLYLGSRCISFIKLYSHSQTQSNSNPVGCGCRNRFLHLCRVVTIFTNPSTRAGYDTRSIFKSSLTGFNSEFSFSLTSCLIKAEETSLLYYLPIAGGRIIGFIPFPRVLVLCEMQSVSSRIWTRVAVSISYDDNHYTTGTSQRGLNPPAPMSVLDMTLNNLMVRFQ